MVDPQKHAKPNKTAQTITNCMVPFIGSPRAAKMYYSEKHQKWLSWVWV
jgi:hypothetical protein